MDKTPAHDLRDEFPRPLPHPKFFVWACFVVAVAGIYASLYFNGIARGENIVFWAVTILVAVAAIRGKWIR